MRASKVALFFLGAALLETGCFQLTPSADPSFAKQLRNQAVLALPSKDEVALVDGRPFSIAGYLAIKANLKSHSAEAAYWVGTGTLALQNATRARGQELQVSAAIELARYALGELSLIEARASLDQYFSVNGEPPSPSEVRTEIDRLIASSVVRRNEHLLSSLNQS